MLSSIGKLFVTIGSIFLIVGVLLIFSSKLRIPFLGRLPGDILLERKNFIFYFPLTTSILISIFLSAILYFLFRK
ncbi:MAG: hypothetical protein B6D56_01095 [Candidatus Omnitrophica bacterium 4484_70.1]|nr:MAG: hypothetical protein B6D56_01095 [Candidatus Omnitrophica bacterium 4484_70.1]